METQTAAHREPTIEQRLVVSLAAWATWSVGVGGVMWHIGGRDGARSLRDAGRTTVGWGLADAAIAGWGLWRGRRSSAAGAGARDRRMAQVTGANALLDVAYVTAGVRLTGRPGRRGTGAAVTVQGLFLLYLDTRYCLEFAASARAHGKGLVLSGETEGGGGAPTLGPCTRPASTTPVGRGGPGGE